MADHADADHTNKLWTSDSPRFPELVCFGITNKEDMRHSGMCQDSADSKPNARASGLQLPPWPSKGPSPPTSSCSHHMAMAMATIMIVEHAGGTNKKGMQFFRMCRDAADNGLQPNARVSACMISIE